MTVTKVPPSSGSSVIFVVFWSCNRCFLTYSLYRGKYGVCLCSMSRIDSYPTEVVRWFPGGSIHSSYRTRAGGVRITVYRHSLSTVANTDVAIWNYAYTVYDMEKMTQCHPPFPIYSYHCNHNDDYSVMQCDKEEVCWKTLKIEVGLAD